MLLGRGAALAATGATAALLLAVPTPASAAAPVAQASAQAVTLNLARGALTLHESNPATSATNDGAGSNAPVAGSPQASALSGQRLLTAGALAETAGADRDGSSYACAGVLSPGGRMRVAAGGSGCTATGPGTGGVTIDLAQIPGAAAVLPNVASLTLTADSLVAHAADHAPSAATGGAAIAGLTAEITAYPPGLLAPITAPVPIPSGPNQDLLAAALHALTEAARGNPAMTGLIDSVSGPLASAVSLTANYQQTLPNGTFGVSALHVAVRGNSDATADLATVTVGPNAAPTTTRLASSANPVTVGQHVGYTAVITPKPGGGTVAFTDNGRPIPHCGSQAVDRVTGTATCRLAYAVVGSHAIVASYSGEAGYAGSRSQTLTQTVDKTATSTTLTSSTEPAAAGQQITYTATVTPVRDPGTVAFTDNGTAIPGCGARPLDRTTGRASCQVSYDQPGSHRIVATYSGDAGSAPSTSAALTQTVNAAASLAATGAPVGELALIGALLILAGSIVAGSARRHATRGGSRCRH